MGYNIAGLVIANNYEKDINKLSQDLKWGIEVTEEITYEIASANWTPANEFRLYFSDKATMIFFSHEWVVNQYRSRYFDTLNYAYSETFMAYGFDLFQQGILIRSIMEHEGQIKMQRGGSLELEKANPSVSGLTFATINSLLEEDFTRISGSQIAYRCKKVNFIERDEQFLKMKEQLDQSPALRELLRQEIVKRTAK